MAEAPQMAATKEEEQKATQAVVCPECGAAPGVPCFLTRARARKNHRYADAHPKWVVAWRAWAWQMDQNLI
jgi:hypothetical protein